MGLIQKDVVSVEATIVIPLKSANAMHGQFQLVRYR